MRPPSPLNIIPAAESPKLQQYSLLLIMRTDTQVDPLASVLSSVCMFKSLSVAWKTWTRAALTRSESPRAFSAIKTSRAVVSLAWSQLSIPGRVLLK